MAEVRTAFLHFLRADDRSAARASLSQLAEAPDLAAARADLVQDPASADAAAAVLVAMLRDDAAPEAVVETAKSFAGRAPRDERGFALIALVGETVWRLGGDPQVAEPFYRRLRRVDLAHPEVLAFYRSLFSSEDASAQLIQVLVQARRSSRDIELRLQLAQEIADIAETRANSPDRAIEIWRSVVREDGPHPKATAALERLYRAGEKWTALVELLKDELEKLPDSPEAASDRIDRLLEISTLYRDKLRLDTMALATLQRVLEIDPTHEASLDALAETYAVAGRFNDLLGVYERRIKAAEQDGNEAQQVALLRKVAHLWVERLGNPQRALDALKTILRLAPRDEDARALLGRIHEQRRDFRALIALRREELEHLEGERALALRIELALLTEEKLGERKEAIEAWNDVLEHHGDVDRALAALARLYEREGRWTSAAEVLHRKLGYCTRGEAIRLLQHLGGLYGDRIQSRTDAVAVWSELLRLVPGHDKALRRLRDAFVSEHRWDDLTRLFDEQQRLPELVDVLQGAADRLEDVDARVDLYRRIAAVCRERLAQPERALKALERTLAIQPHNLEVARELLPIYREQGNWARLLGTYEVLLRETHDVEERLRLLVAVLEITQTHLNAPTLTLHWAVVAYRLAPGRLDLRQQLERAAERADGWDALTRVFEERLASDDVEDAERLALLERLAVVARDHLYKPDDAQRYFRRIIAIEPGNALAMAALEEIYTQTRRWEDLAEVFRRRLSVADEGASRQRILRRLAALEESQLGDLDAAVKSYGALLAIDASDVEALDRLIEIHRKRGRWPQLAEVLERRLEHATQRTVRVPLIVELAEVQVHHLGDYASAAQSLLAVLELELDEPRAVMLLEDIRASEPSLAVTVTHGLLPVYRRAGDRAHEADAMELLLAHEEDPQARRAWMEQLAALYEQLEARRTDALRLRRDLFVAHPQQWQARRKLMDLAIDLGHPETVAEAYRQVLSAWHESGHDHPEATPMDTGRDRLALRRDLLLEHAVFVRDHLADTAEAEQAFGEVLDLDETHEMAYEALETLLRARCAHRELVALYRRRADVTFNQREQRTLLSQIISMSRDVLGDHATAVATAEELLDLIPDDRSTLELLSEMYAAGQTTDDRVKLEEVLGRRVELQGDRAEARRLQVWRAELRMQVLGDAFGAVDLLGQVVSEDPDDAAAKRLLEELLAIAPVQLEACALLDPIYRQLGDHEGRIRLLTIRREHAESAGLRDEAINHLVEIARIAFEFQDDRERAFEVLREALLMEPTRTDVRRKAERLGVSLERHAELVALWEQLLADDRIDEALRVELMVQVARTVDQHLCDAVAARNAYARLLAADPPDVTLAKEASAALCRLHFELGDWVAWVEAKRHALRYCDGRDEQVKVRLELAGMLRELRDRVEAALMYGEVLDLDPANAEALDALELLFTEECEWPHLAALLEHRIVVTSEARRKAALWRQLGQLRERELGDQAGAMAAYQSMLDLKVGHEESHFALHALVAIHERAERWADVEEGLRRLLMLAESDAERCTLLIRTAVVVGRELGRGSDALELLKRVLDREPADAEARREVHRYLELDETRERAIRILSPLYESEQNWHALLELEELQARKQPSGRRRLQALLKVAKTHEERLSDDGRAFIVLCEALAEAADQPELESILDKVEQLGAEPDRAPRLFEAFAETAEHILDAALQRRVLLAQGEVALERMGRPDLARAAYERVLEGAPHDRSAQHALECIYLRLELYEELATLLISRAERETDTTRRDDALVRAAEVRRAQLGDSLGAIELYHRLSADGIARPEVSAILEPLYEEAGLYRELATHLTRRLSQLQGPAAVDVHLRLGHLHGHRLEDRQAALTHLSTALRLDPGHAVATQELDRYLEDPSLRAEVLELLEPIFVSVQAWDRLIALQELRLADAADEAQRFAILRKIARTEEEQLEDLDRAFASYERLFHEQPSNTDVRDQLARLAGVLGQQERYASLLTGYVEGELADDASPSTLQLVEHTAHLWASTLRQPARAVPLLRRLHEARPHDPNVLVALESALTQAEMWEELARTYWAEADGAQAPERRLEFLRKLATLAEELLDNPDEAVRAYRRMLELDPTNDDARSRLERTLERTGAHQPLLELLQERAAQTSDPMRRKGFALRIAQLQSGPLQDPDGAVDTLEVALAETPDDAALVKTLEQLAERCERVRGRVLELLRPVYEHLGDVHRLVEIDEWSLAHTEDPERRHALYRSMGALLLRDESSAEAAFHTLCRGLAEPGPADALHELDEELMRVAERLSMQRALAEARWRASQAPALELDVERRLDLLCDAAQMLLDLRDFATTVEVCHEATALRADHEDVLALYDRALSETGDMHALASILSKRIELTLDDSARRVLARRLARLAHDALGDLDLAQSAWSDLLDLEPGDREALRRLCEIHRERHALSELVTSLERLVDATDDTGDRRSLRLELAALHRAEQREHEIDVLQAILVEHPDDDEVLGLLTEALVARERFEEAVEVLAMRANVAGEATENKLALWLRAARLRREALGDLHGALALYRAILEAAPTHEEAVHDLLSVVVARGHHDETAVALLVPALETMQRHGDLEAVLEVVATHTAEPHERVTALRRLVHLREEVLGDRAKAHATLARLLELVDEGQLEATLGEAARLALELGEGRQHVERVAQLAATPERGGGAQTILLLHAAEVAEARLDQPQLALDLLRPLVDGGLMSLELCGTVERLGQRCGDLDVVVLALQEAARFAPEAHVRASALVRLGHAQHDRGHTEAALEAYAEAFDLTASDDALAGLERLLEGPPTPRLLELLETAYRARGELTQQVRILRIRLANAGEHEALAILETLGNVCDEGGGTDAESLQAWSNVLALDVHHMVAAERVTALGRQPDLRAEAVTALERAIDRAREQGITAPAPLALAAIEMLLGEDARRAFDLAAAALDEQPDHLDLLRLFVQAARATGVPATIHDALVRAATWTMVPDEAAALWWEAAAVAEGGLGRLETAVEDLEHLLEADESHGQGWSKLLTLLTTMGNYDALAGALERRIATVADMAQRRALRHRLARVCVERLGRMDDAVAVYQDMLGDDLGDHEAAAELEQLLRQLERWSDVRDLLERKLDGATDARTLVLEELAQLAEHQLGDPSEAIERYQQLLAEFPDHTAADLALERLLRVEERWVELSELFETRLARQRDTGDPRWRETCCALSALLAEHLAHPERAVELLEALLAEDAAYTPALIARATVHRALGDEDAARRTLEQALAQDPAGSAGAQVHLQLSQLAQDPAVRHAHLEAAVELDPTHEQAGAELVALCREQARWEQVSMLLDVSMQRTGDETARRALLLDRVDVLLEHLRDADGALRLLAPLYRQVQDDTEVNRRIADALFMVERFDEAAGMYNWLVAMGRRDQRGKILAHDLTRMARIKLRQGVVHEARELLLEAYRIDATRPETLMALGQLHERSNAWHEALKVYRAMLLQNVERSGLLRRGDIYLQIAKAHLALDESAKARTMLLRGLEEDATHPELGEQLASLPA